MICSTGALLTVRSTRLVTGIFHSPRTLLRVRLLLWTALASPSNNFKTDHCSRLASDGAWSVPRPCALPDMNLDLPHEPAKGLLRWEGTRKRGLWRIDLPS